MDDEEIIRTVVSKMLEQCGFEAECARDGDEMLALYTTAKDSGVPFDAVIIDLIITGGMGGKEAIKRLIEIDPNITAIVSSGYSEDPVVSSFREFGFKGVLSKPYAIAELSAALQKVTGKK